MNRQRLRFRIAMTVLTAAAMPALARVSAQSWNPEDLAVDRCEQELVFSMGREAGGRSPDAGLDYRSLDVRQQGRNTVSVRGRGNYRRDNLDYGRPYTFSCTFDTRNSSARASYDWTGEFGGGGYDEPGYQRPPSYRPRYGGGSYGDEGGGSSAYPPTGRVFFSGGILNRASGKGLDVKDEARRDGANIQQWDFGGKANQTWEVVDQGRGEFAIVNQGSGKVLDVANDAAGDGADVQLFRWHNGDNQRWRLQRTGAGFYQVVSVSSGRCLDVDAARVNENGANVQQWSCSGAPNQQWRFAR